MATSKDFSQRLLTVLSLLEMTPYRFSKTIGYKGAETIYRLLDGKIEPSVTFFKRVENSGLPINMEYLKENNFFEKPLLSYLKKGGYGNEIGINEGILYPCDLGKNYLKKIALHLIDEQEKEIELHLFTVFVSISGFHGLDFKFYFFMESDDKTTLHLDRKYSYIIEHDWRIISYVDHWTSVATYWRSQSLGFKTEEQDAWRRKYDKKIEHSLADVQNEILDIAKDEKAFFRKNSFLRVGDSPKLIFSSDTSLPDFHPDKFVKR